MLGPLPVSGSRLPRCDLGKGCRKSACAGVYLMRLCRIAPRFDSPCWRCAALFMWHDLRFRGVRKNGGLSRALFAALTSTVNVPKQTVIPSRAIGTFGWSRSRPSRDMGSVLFLACSADCSRAVLGAFRGRRPCFRVLSRALEPTAATQTSCGKTSPTWRYGCHRARPSYRPSCRPQVPLVTSRGPSRSGGGRRGTRHWDTWCRAAPKPGIGRAASI